MKNLWIRMRILKKEAHWTEMQDIKGAEEEEHRGFALIEMILVIIILSVLVSLSWPGFRHSFLSLQCRNIAYDIAGLMRYAQGRAIAERRGYCFVLDHGSRRFQIRHEIREFEAWGEEAPTAAGKKCIPLKESMGRAGIIPDGHSVNTDKASIRFYPDGQIDKAVIEVCREAHCFVITTQAQRGRVHVFAKESE